MAFGISDAAEIPKARIPIAAPDTASASGDAR